MEEILIWGVKTHSLFDVWSIEHFFSGMGLGATAMLFTDKKIKVDDRYLIRTIEILFVLLIAFSWEAVEHYLEVGLLGEAVKNWFHGVEFWANRLIFDPLLVLIGYLFVSKYKKLIIPARIFTITWLLIHIFILEHSMSLHEIF